MSGGLRFVTEKFDLFKIQRYNNKRKPWRQFRWAVKKKISRRPGIGTWLILLACLEAAVLIPGYGQAILHETRSFFTVSRNMKLETEKDYIYNGDAGETKERGFSLDWKDGKVKLWQKVERVVFKKTD